jgi:hypothetical protein
MTEREKRLELDAILDQCNEDERAVIVDTALAIARRMLTGRQRYAPLDLATDRRDWLAETSEELADGLAYVQMALLQRRR